MIELLESRVLFSVDTSSVALYTAAGQRGAAINRHMALVVLVHGDNMNASLMTDMATAVQGQLPTSEYQVLILDWSKLDNSLTTNTSKNAVAVGDRLAKMITQSRVPTSRVNLIGFSMGGTVIGEAARDLKTSTTEVNSIIGVDAAALNGTADYAKVALHSLAFCGNDSLGGTAGSLSATDAVLLTGLSSVALEAHSDVFTAVTAMWQKDAAEDSTANVAVSSTFSVQSIITGQIPSWRKKTFSSFDADLVCSSNDGSATPLSLTYKNIRGHYVFVE